MDGNAIREYIAAGHSAKQAAVVFGCSDRAIRHHAGDMTKLRERMPPGKPRRNWVKRATYFSPDAWAWILEQGGTPFLRRLVDNAMRAAA